MSKCVHHPSRDGVLTVGLQSYCADCQKGIEGARLRVDKHVEPKDCFVWYAGSNNWQPIAGTGCAHFVAHRLGIKRGSRSEQCAEGFPYRVRTMIQGMKPVAVADVKVDDVYVTPQQDHTGIVIRVMPGPTGKPPNITIRHASSGQGKVADDQFAIRFRSRGTFHRQ